MGTAFVTKHNSGCNTFVRWLKVLKKKTSQQIVQQTSFS
jgi:hypothetical protein